MKICLGIDSPQALMSIKEQARDAGDIQYDALDVIPICHLATLVICQACLSSQLHMRIGAAARLPDLPFECIAYRWLQYSLVLTIE